MPTVTPTTQGAVGTQVGGAKNKPNDLKDLDINQFLQLMITELTNQDPLNPMDNAQLVQQIGELRQISATTTLVDSLNQLTSGQSLSSASTLIGKRVKALDDKAKDVTGVVDKVTVDVDPKDPNKRSYRLRIGTSDVELKNVREVLPDQTS